MIERRWLKPRDGRAVPLEDGSPWPPEGAEVEVTLYVRRRIADQDVEPCDPIAAAEPAATDDPPADQPAETENETRRRGSGKTGGK